MANIQKISPFIWFDTQAEEAANLYVSLFENSKILSISRYGDAGPGPKGSVMVVEFQLAGQSFMAINGGPIFKLSEAFSLMVDAADQGEVDSLWSKLSANGGEESCRNGPWGGSRDRRSGNSTSEGRETPFVRAMAPAGFGPGGEPWRRIKQPGQCIVRSVAHA